MFFGAVGGAVSFGVGSLFSSHLTGATALATSIEKGIGGVGLAIVQAGTHAVSQGVLGLMQGQDFLSASLSGFAGSLGASGFAEAIESRFISHGQAYNKSGWGINIQYKHKSYTGSVYHVDIAFMKNGQGAFGHTLYSPYYNKFY